MKQSNKFINDMLDMELPESSNDRIWLACKPVSAKQEENTIILDIPFQAQKEKCCSPDKEVLRKNYRMTIRAYGDSIVRISIAFEKQMPLDEDNVMLEWDQYLNQVPLTVNPTDCSWDIRDNEGRLKMKINIVDKPTQFWSNLIESPQESFSAEIFPDSKTGIPFMCNDTFVPQQVESISLGYIERKGIPNRCLFSLHARHNEKFAGTGERFSKMDLSGQTIILENTDGMGVNNRRAYKNIPFYVSSRPYGLLMMTSAHTRLSIADISKRAIQAVIEESDLDLFFIGGGSVESIVYNYRRITGFPRQVPLWSYGTWMSRMTYFSAKETFDVAEKLREGKFPCDVLHLDTGWFKTDWKCEWEFSPERFPEPEEYMKSMKNKGFRISLWQLPSIAKGTAIYETAVKNGYVAPKKNHTDSSSNFLDFEYGGNIDFTNPEAVKWYQGLLEKLLKMGTAVIKTDFGEEIDMESDYYGMPAVLLHNLYCLLYQKAAFEITQKVKEEGIIWARAGWIGCQRYPVHWGGDCACTWDGLAGSIRGGLHIGVSGFAFWSHDVPGFHGLPDFMNNRPDDDLYVRWTQMGVFTSHLRYHGSTPREPYEYPNVAHIVRKWLNLRYALIPYLFEQGNKVVKTGFPLLRALIFHHGDDPFCWNVDDQFYCGDNLLIAPVINSEGVRDIYLPEARWIDFWTGEVIDGPVLMKNVKSPLERIPVYARAGSVIPVYPEVVQCTDEMSMSETVRLVFDINYKGLSSSVLGRTIEL